MQVKFGWNLTIRKSGSRDSRLVKTSYLHIFSYVWQVISGYWFHNVPAQVRLDAWTWEHFPLLTKILLHELTIEVLFNGNYIVKLPVIEFKLCELCLTYVRQCYLSLCLEVSAHVNVVKLNCVLPYFCQSKRRFERG